MEDAHEDPSIATGVALSFIAATLLAQTGPNTVDAHIAAEWGGTGFNFTVTPEKPRRYWYETYASSSDHLRDVVKKAGADVLIANHPEQDAAKPKLAALARRRAGDPNPYVIGNDSVTRYVTMVGECARASLLRFAASTK